MPHALAQRHLPKFGQPALAFLALLFAVATYLVFSIRGMLAPESVNIIQLRRAVTSAGGGIVFWLILRRLSTSPLAMHGGPARLAKMLVLAGVVLFGMRITYSWLDSSESVSLAQNVRWTISWLGYLGFGIALYLAAQLRVEARSAAAAGPSVAGPARDRADSIDWLADAIVSEFEAATVQDRRELAERLRVRAGYRQSDALDGRANRRVTLIERLADRLSQ